MGGRLSACGSAAWDFFFVSFVCISSPTGLKSNKNKRRDQCSGNN